MRGLVFIKQELSINEEIVAKEVAVELYELGIIPSTERNYTAPRLTELEQMGLVQVISKKKCDYTGKTVAVYEITPEGLEKRFNNVRGEE